MVKKVFFNVLAKDLENAVEISRLCPEKLLVGLMVKDFSDNEEAVKAAKAYIKEGILVSVGLGAGDPAMWKRVADVSAEIKPYHVNQVFPAAGYTLGRLKERGQDKFILNSLIEPGNEPGMVYISTGEISRQKKEAVSCTMAAKLMADIGLKSVKFYPVEGNKKLDHIKAMAEAAINEGIEIFEPTGSLSLENVYEVVKTCLETGAKTVIPHLYTSLMDKETGRTKPEYIEMLLKMKW